MLSKGGKIEWSCPYCKSTDIRYGHVRPVMAALMRPVAGEFTDKEWEEGIRLEDDHGECDNCGHWFWWNERIKTSLKSGKTNRITWKK